MPGDGSFCWTNSTLDGEVGRDAAARHRARSGTAATGVGGRRSGALRLYRPRPTLAFSGRDCASPGHRAAAGAIAQRPGSRRFAAGRAVGPPPTTGAAIVPGSRRHRIRPGRPTSRPGSRRSANCWPVRCVGRRRRQGRPGAGEYCPGEFSINDGHGHKLVGTAQRLVRGGWLFSTVILVGDPEPVREVLVGVLRRARAWTGTRPTVGAVQTTAPGVQVTDVAAAVVPPTRGSRQLGAVRRQRRTRRAGQGRTDRHRLPDG